MTKNKSHQGMKKRVKKTAQGRLRRQRAFQSHLLKKKSARKKQIFRQDFAFSNYDKNRVRKLIKA